MYRYFQTQNLVEELDKEIEIASHLVQLIIDDFIFEKVGENLIKKLKEGISVEVVIVSKSNKKSIRLVNYAKEIIDLNGLVYFLIDKAIITATAILGRTLTKLCKKLLELEILETIYLSKLKMIKHQKSEIDTIICIEFIINDAAK